MPIQTTYNFQNDKLVKGMKAYALPCTSKTGYASVPIPFGLGLAYGGDVGLENRPQLALPSATGFTFMGISLHTHKQAGFSQDGFGVLTTTAVARYEVGDDITFLTKGAVVVQTEVAVDLDDPVFLRHTANGGNNPGNFRINADTDRADQILNARWLTKTTGAGLAVVEINVP